MVSFLELVNLTDFGNECCDLSRECMYIWNLVERERQADNRKKRNCSTNLSICRKLRLEKQQMDGIVHL